MNGLQNLIDKIRRRYPKDKDIAQLLEAVEMMMQVINLFGTGRTIKVWNRT